MRRPFGTTAALCFLLFASCEKHNAAVYGTAIIAGRTPKGPVLVLDAEQVHDALRSTCNFYDVVIRPLELRRALLSGASDVQSLGQLLDVLRELQTQSERFAKMLDTAMKPVVLGQALADANGHYSVGHLPAGRIAVYATTQLSGQSTVSAWRLADLRRGQFERVDLGDGNVVASDPLCPKQDTSAVQAQRRGR